ncbi:SGNH/GDSL hydrolase family protein [Rubrolithibacter danxiaensis]|uniref:SGNH/GDSL hydrolase family protein n=1 Tax=Rubrolithibacter danxiaensis TaxID=3390805 RepID=UPI003BF90A32
MKLSLFLLSGLLLFCGFQDNKPTRIIFFGDSITQAGAQPGGYITLMNDMLKENKKDKNYELVGAGIGGNKVYDLYLRHEEDVLSKKPDVVVIWVGVNDVWHKRLLLTGTDPDKFEKFYQALISKFEAQNIKVVLVTPAVVGEKTDYSNELDGDLNKYSQIIRDLAVKNTCELVDLRKDFHEYLLKNNPENKEKGILTVDGVHLTPEGNKFVADKMYKLLVK